MKKWLIRPWAFLTLDFVIFNILLGISNGSNWVLVAGINALAVSTAVIFARAASRRGKEMDHSSCDTIYLSAKWQDAALLVLLGSAMVAAGAALVPWVPAASWLMINFGKLVGIIITATIIAFFRLKRREPVSSGWTGDQFEAGLVSIVIPAYNEKKRLPARLQKLAAALPSMFPVEIIVVDDGSTDNTRELADGYASRYPFIRSIGYKPNQGKGRAVQFGALQARGEYVIYTDADETFTAEHLGMLVEELKKGRTVVAGARRSAGGERLEGESRLRFIMGRTFNFLVSTMFFMGLNDTQCGLKGFERQAARELFSRQRLRGFAFDVELLALARALGYDIHPMPVKAMDCEGSSVNRLLAPVQMAWDMLKLRLALFSGRYNLPGQDERRLDWGIAASLAGLAMMVRIPWLWVVPRYIDELKEVNVGFLIYNGYIMPLHNAAHDLGAFHNYMLASFFYIFGPNIWTSRLYVAILGALTVALAYFCGRRLFNSGVGLLAALFLMVDGMHILVGHSAWGNCTTAFFFMAAMLATQKAEDEKSGGWLAFAAFLWALTLQTHSSVIIYIAIVAIYLLRPAFRRRTGLPGRSYIAAAGVFSLAYANMIYYNLNTMASSVRWMSRKQYALELHPGIAAYFENAWNMLAEMMRSLGSVYTDHSASWQYLLEPAFLAALLFTVIGAAAAARRGKGLILWLLAGSFLILPWINERYVFYVSSRYIMPLIVCATVLMAAGIYEFLARLIRRLKRPALASGIAVIVIAALLAGQLYAFYAYCAEMNPTAGSNSLSLRIVGDTDRLCPDSDTLVVVDGRLNIPNSPLPYLLSFHGRPFVVSPYILEKGSVDDTIREKLAASPGKPLVAVLSDESYTALKGSRSFESVCYETCRAGNETVLVGMTVYIVRIDQDYLGAGL